jgi:hypothetical protein
MHCHATNLIALTYVLENNTNAACAAAPKSMLAITADRVNTFLFMVSPVFFYAG